MYYVFDIEFMMCASNIELTVGEDNLDIAFDYIDTVSLIKYRIKVANWVCSRFEKNLEQI